MLKAAGPVGIRRLLRGDQGVGIEAADVANGRGGQPKQHDQRDQRQVGGDLGHVLNALEADERRQDAPHHHE